MTRVFSNNPDEFLRWRNIETACEKCGGKGGRTYASTSTWRGGMGGASLTWDVCDECWGSGDAEDHWLDLRRLRNEQDARVAKEAGELLGRRIGAGLRTMLPAIEALCLVLDKEAKRRKPPMGTDFWDHYQWQHVCNGLAGVLREMIKAAYEEAKNANQDR